MSESVYVRIYMIGIKGAKLKVAINEDSQVAIFEECDPGRVSDFKEIVPSFN